MRFGHVRVAAVTILSGGFLTLGVLGTAYAAPQASAATNPVCQALPTPGSPKPSPSPKPSTSPSPKSSTSPSPTTSPSASSSSTAAAPASSAAGGTNQSSSVSPGQTNQTASASTGSGSSSSPAASAPTAAAALDAHVAADPSGSPSPSGSTNTSTAPPTQLCVSVLSSQSSIKRGQTATYSVQVSTHDGSASNVSVALTAQPSTQKPEFTSGCTRGDGTASCTVSSVTATTPATLKAQIAVASNATSVTSLTLTATASIATTAKWTPPAATGTTSVTAAAQSSAKGSTGSTGTMNLPPIPLGSIPNLSEQASLYIGAGNAAGLFPDIGPSPTPGAGQVVHQQAGRPNAEPVSDASTVSLGSAPVFTAQVVGLIALGLAIMLTVTRLSLRRRSGSRGAGN